MESAGHETDGRNGRVWNARHNNRGERVNSYFAKMSILRLPSTCHALLCLVFLFPALLCVNLMPCTLLYCISSALMPAECVAFYFSFFVFDRLRQSAIKKCWLIFFHYIYVWLSRQQPQWKPVSWSNLVTFRVALMWTVSECFVRELGSNHWRTSDRAPLGQGATENAGVENAIRAKLQGWKMQEWKKRE